MALAIEPKCSPGIVLTARLKELAANAAANSLAATNRGPAVWYRPAGFTDTLLDPTKLHEPFSREQQELEFAQAVTGTESCGTTTDLAMVQLQGDLMHCAERAFRSRHQTSVRSRIHPAARLAGHGATLGVILQGMLGYVNDLDRLNKSEEDINASTLGDNPVV